ncbi:MAG TPA: serine hydrolase domain-containing protein [Candidatus Saccharimonadales bacterium]|nr:serine hydrolase domain-containing protein [Candidatus Saccharimonadales bacterium]
MTNLRLELELLINRNVEERLFPACVIGAITPHQKLVVAGGTFTYEDKRPVSVDSIFDTASLTKAVPTSSLALKLIEQKKLSLQDDIRRYLPQYKNAVTVWHLLTQTVYYEFGFALSSLAGKSAEEIMDIIFKTPVKISRSESHYTNTSSILLGMVVEKIYGQDLAAAADQVFFKPLDMARSGFAPLALAPIGQIVPTEVTGEGGPVHGLVHDESARAFARPVGSAGLFSTVPDLLKFLRVLLAGGSAAGQPIFSPRTVELMVHNQLSGGSYTGLGWELNQPRFMGRFANGTFGKTGFTGCLFLGNPKLKAGLVILSNHVYPKRPVDFEPVNQFRRATADLVFGSALKSITG